jgi:hypothetical protein
MKEPSSFSLSPLQAPMLDPGDLLPLIDKNRKLTHKQNRFRFMEEEKQKIQ